MINIFLDDIRRPPSDGREWVVVTTAWQCIALLGRNPRNVDTLSLDHDLGDPAWGTGYDVAKWLEGCAGAAKYKYLPTHILCHSANPVGVYNILRAVDQARRLQNFDYTLLGEGYSL